MKQFLKNTIKKIIQKLTTLLSSTKVGRLVNEVIVNDVMNRVQEMEHNGLRMKFTVPNSLNRFRVESFSTKEPGSKGPWNKGPGTKGPGMGPRLV